MSVLIHANNYVLFMLITNLGQCVQKSNSRTVKYGLVIRLVLKG